MIKIECFRQNGADASSEDFDSSSSILETEKQARYTRRSRSYSRNRARGRASDSSPTAIRKKTTFVTENGQAPGPCARDHANAITEEKNINGGSIKSSSSYDASKISFQGKRAIFEKTQMRTPQSTASKSQETLGILAPAAEAQSHLEDTNRRLEGEVARLEQALVLREESSRRLKERLEIQLGAREGELQGDLRRLVRDNATKEEIIQ